MKSSVEGLVKGMRGDGGWYSGIRGDVEERRRVGGVAMVVLRSFTFVSTSPQTSDC